MTLSNHRLWFGENAKRRVELESLDEVRRFVTESEKAPTGELNITADIGARPWWQQMFGLRRYVWVYFIVTWKADGATLSFMEKDGGEHAAQGPLTKEQAFAAIREFLDSGERPGNLKYAFTP